MIEELVIRILTKSDFVESKMIRLESLREAPLNFGSSYEDELLFDDDVWLTRLSNKDAITFGAFIGSNIVGSITLSLSRRLKTKHNAEIHGMYVKEEHQKKGVGFKLISALIEYSN